MKKIKLLTLGLALTSLLTSCNSNSKYETIVISASEVPHSQILKECVNEILNEKGYSLDIKILDWTLQNDALANYEIDANYFQHIPYLNTYSGNTKLIPACKVHYERLCLYASNPNNKDIKNGSTFEIVDDISNVERALNLLEENKILSINSNAYNDKKEFVNFESAHPEKYITFNENYKDCKLTCIAEELLATSLDDYDFGVIPGNTAMTGVSNYSSKIVLSENDPVLEDEKANVIAIREEDKNSNKIKALVDSFNDERVKNYIETTYKESVSYHYVNLLY